MFGKTAGYGILCILLSSCATIIQSQPASEKITKAQRADNGTDGLDESQKRLDQISWASQCKKWDEWDKSGPAYRIYGNSYYVGTCGISALLVTGDRGHILIDSGTQAGADIVLRNITAFGFNPTDIKYIIHSHEHFDHVGGFAKLKNATGAKIISSEAARETIESGEISTKDPQFGTHSAMQPVKVDGIIKNGETIMLGNIKLTAISTPGHSPGALSWQWNDCEMGECASLVYADSLSPISNDRYKFGEHPNYLRDYQNGIKRLAQLQCDILLTPHPSSSNMIDRIKQDHNLYTNSSCSEYSAAISSRLDKRLTEEYDRK